MMLQKTILSLLLISTFTSSQAADHDDRWIVKNPYEGKVYQKENVSFFAQGANKITTVVVGCAIIGAGAYYAANHWHTVPLDFSPLGNLGGSYTLPLNVPSLGSLGHVGVAGAAVTFVGFPVDVAATYGAKKIAQGVEAVAKSGWKVVRWGFGTAAAYWDNFRAEKLQGTLFHNHHVKYVSAQDMAKQD